MELQEKMQFIANKLGKEELLTGIAEEATELAQSALKLRRVCNKLNYTPISEDEAFENLIEEMTDLELCFNVFEYLLTEKEKVQIFIKKREIYNKKINRWFERLEGKE